MAALELTVYIDYHCPYSARVVRWLAGLGPERVRPRYRFFSLEQVNRDPAAGSWRIWEQPLDYEHHRGRRDRRSLAAFLVTDLLERRESPAVVERFRHALLDARFHDGADLSDLALLAALAAGAGADATALGRALGDEAALAVARRRIADDWEAARERFETFGVPTLDLGDDPPVYLRLERDPTPAEGLALLDGLLGLRRAAPFLLELKVPERRVPEPVAGPAG